MKQLKPLTLVVFSLFPAGWICGCFNENAVRLGPEPARYIVECHPAVPNDVHGVDILVVVDNSDSIDLEQELLVEAFPSLLEGLMDPLVDPMIGRPVHHPVKDLHVGVVSTDMGSGGYVVSDCNNSVIGDDGILQNKPRGETCAEAYPDFLSHQPESYDRFDRGDLDRLAGDFG